MDIRYDSMPNRSIQTGIRLSASGKTEIGLKQESSGVIRGRSAHNTSATDGKWNLLRCICRQPIEGRVLLWKIFAGLVSSHPKRIFPANPNFPNTMASFFPDFLPTPKRRQFNINPRYYDPEKERLEQLKKKYDQDSPEDQKLAEAKARIHGSFQRSNKKPQGLLSNRKLLIFLFIVVVLILLIMK